MIPFRRHCAALMAALATALASSFAAAAVYVHIEVEGVINPVKARYVERALRRAEAEHAGFLLLTLNTPGGLVSSMEVITRAFANAPLPVVGYVEPRTAQATSAGALILLSTDIAAMAPNTRVGAAHPVDTEGKQLQGPMNDKATNSMVALAKSLLARRKRPEAVADAIVRKSESFTASEAKEQGIIEIIAADRAGLLAALDGRRVEMAKREVTLHTRGARAVELPLTFTERTLDVLAEPTIATMLLSIGVLSVLYELSSPGIGMAGMVGIVSILVGLVGLSLLPVRAGGVVLMLAALGAIILEAKVNTHGVLAVGGIVGTILGALLLVDEADYFGALQTPKWQILLPFLLLFGVLFVLILKAVRRAMGARFQTGAEALIGKRGQARTRFAAKADRFSGTVFVDGARWEAISDGAIDPGQSVEVTSLLREPTRLVVKPSERR